MLIKDINFFDRYNETQRREKNVSKQTTVRVAIGAIIIIITVMTGTTFQILNTGLQNEINAINNYLNSPEVAEQLQVLNEKQKILDNVTNYYNGINTATQKINTIVKPDRALVESIIRLLPTDLVITDFNYSTGNITLKCEAMNDEKIAQLAHALRSLESISEVRYNGFDKKGEEGTMKSSTTISISLNPGGTKNAANE